MVHAIGSILINLVSKGDPFELQRSIYQNSKPWSSNLEIMQQRSPEALISHKFLTNLMCLDSVTEFQNTTENSTRSYF